MIINTLAFMRQSQHTFERTRIFLRHKNIMTNIEKS